MIVDINELREHLNYINKVNKHNLSEITFMKDGKVLDVSNDDIDEFKFIGLNNVYFVTHYKEWLNGVKNDKQS